MRAGLAAVPSWVDVVVVHDAARPLVTPDLVERCLAALADADCAIAATPVTDTVKEARDGVVLRTLDRSGLWAVQTPQAFAAGTLRQALAGDISAASDCSSLVEAIGGRVKVVPGDPRLLKVTAAVDLERVAALL